MTCFLKQRSILLVLLLTFSPLPAFSGQCNNDDKTALDAINAHFGFPYHFASWTNNTPCCDWYDVDCDSNGRVIGLSVFHDTALNGTIPEAIGDLPFLQQLMFHTNFQSGRLDSFVHNQAHSSITARPISSNSLSGPVPSFLSNLTSLTFLTLASNQFSGTIPPPLSNLHNLGALHLDRNMLTGSIPASFGTFRVNYILQFYTFHTTSYLARFLAH